MESKIINFPKWLRETWYPKTSRFVSSFIEDPSHAEENTRQVIREIYENVIRRNGFEAFASSEEGPEFLKEFFMSSELGDCDDHTKPMIQFFKLFVNSGLIDINTRDLAASAIEKGDVACANIIINSTKFNWKNTTNMKSLMESLRHSSAETPTYSLHFKIHYITQKIYSDKRVPKGIILCDLLRRIEFSHSNITVIGLIKILVDKRKMDMKKAKFPTRSKKNILHLSMKNIWLSELMEYALKEFPELLFEADDKGRRPIDYLEEFKFGDCEYVKITLLKHLLDNYLTDSDKIEFPPDFGYMIWIYADHPEYQRWLESPWALKDKYLNNPHESYQINGVHRIYNRYSDPETLNFLVNNILPYCPLYCAFEDSVEEGCAECSKTLRKMALPQQLFVMIEFVQSGYLQIDRNSDSRVPIGFFDSFLSITGRVPVELKMLICCRAASMDESFEYISSEKLVKERRRFLLYLNLNKSK